MIYKRNNSPDPFQFMLENRSVIIKIMNEGLPLSDCWKKLTEAIPEIINVTKFNTFKVYARILNLIDRELSEKEMLEAELDRVRQKNKAVIHEQMKEVPVDAGSEEKKRKVSGGGKSGVRQKVPNLERNETAVPGRIDGWGIQLKGPYYRLFKKIEGKVKWIHVGRIKCMNRLNYLLWKQGVRFILF